MVPGREIDEFCRTRIVGDNCGESRIINAIRMLINKSENVGRLFDSARLSVDVIIVLAALRIFVGGEPSAQRVDSQGLVERNASSPLVWLPENRSGASVRRAPINSGRETIFRKEGILAIS